MPRDLSVVLLILAVACRGSESQPVAPRPIESIDLRAPRPVALDILPRDAADSFSLASRIARDFALALADPGIRMALYTSLSSSTVHEGKLHLQRFLANGGASVARKVESRLSLSEGVWERAVRRLADMEMYLPVRGARDTWRGTADLFVAAETRTDDAIKANQRHHFAYDLAGRQILLSSDSAPDRPVLAIVPVETAFSEGGAAPAPPPTAQAYQQCLPEDCEGGGGGGGGGGSPPVLGDSLYLTQLQIYNVDQYEGWLAGDPEITLQIKALNTGLYDPGTILTCGHQDAVPPRRFDQNGNNWAGNVYLTKRQDLEAYALASRAPMIYVWEDDSGNKCDLRPEHNLANEVGYAALAATGAGISSILWKPVPGVWVYTIASAFLAGASYLHITSSDDFIGFATLPSGSDPGGIPNQLLRMEAGQYSVWAGNVTTQFRP